MEINEALSQKKERQEQLAFAKESVISKKNAVELKLENANNEVLKSEKALEFIKAQINEILDSRKLMKKEILKNFIILFVTFLTTILSNVSLPIYAGFIYTILKVPSYIKVGKKSSKKKEKRLQISESSEILNLYDLEGKRDIIQTLYRNIKYQLENIETEERVNNDIIKYLTEPKNSVISKSEEVKPIIDLNEVRRKRINPNVQNG